MLSSLRKSNSRHHEESTFAGSELDKLRKENTLYKSTMEEIDKVVGQMAEGDLSARVVLWDEFGGHTDTLNKLNKACDLVDAFVRESGATLDHAAQGKYYRIFLERGILGNFGDAAKIINAAQNHMEKTEIGRKAETVALADNLESEVKSAVDIVQVSSEEMGAKSKEMSASLTDVTAQANEVVALSNDATNNVETCAAAVEEMSASAQEIYRQVDSSRAATIRAEDELEKTNEIVQGLSTSAEEIGDIANMIKDIASRTNLLALNATIEAARAGEAGKGFAVVASEVKNLASQTADATERVNTQIETIQQMATQTTTAVDRVGKVILESSEISKAVASAAEEQLTATQEISNNVQEAANATRTSAEKVTEVAQKTQNSSSTAQAVSTESSNVTEAIVSLSHKVMDIMGDLRGYDAFNRRGAERHEPASVLVCEMRCNNKLYRAKVSNISLTGASFTLNDSEGISGDITIVPRDWTKEILATMHGNEDGVVRVKFKSGQRALIAEFIKLTNN